jgi:uncharacterized membrane protein
MKRTLVKTVSYRTMNAVYGFAVGMLVTGNVTVALGIVGMEVAYKMVAYFVHERVWESKVLKGALA